MTKMDTDMKRRPYRGVYLLPSMLTVMALFSGFFAILNSFKVASHSGVDFSYSGIAIIIAAFLDGMDGRIARLMKAESEFGSQFDSIADVVSFGVAPAVLVYSAYLHELDRYGWLGSFMFVACAGIRLARFNVVSKQTTEKKYFKGLSSPVAAGGIALLSLFHFSADHYGTKILILVYTIFLAGLMVSNVRFRSFKKLDAAKQRPTQSLLLVVLLILLLFSFQEMALLGFFLIYLLWGLIEEFILFRRRRRSDPNVPFVPFGDRRDDEDSII